MNDAGIMATAAKEAIDQFVEIAAMLRDPEIVAASAAEQELAIVDMIAALELWLAWTKTDGPDLLALGHAALAKIERLA